MAGKKVIEALQLHRKGYNCAQSVAVPFCEELNMDKTAAFRALEGFGGGMGCYGLTCGALSGAVFVAGLVNSDGNIETPRSKRKTYEICKAAVEKFQKECGSDCCHTIKGIDTDKPLVPCDKCIATGAAIAEKILAEYKRK